MLHLRGRTYYSRISIPQALQPVLKRKELWKSLRTSDPQEAQVLSLKVSAEALKLFQGLRKRQAAPSPASVAQAYISRVRAEKDQGDEQTLSLVYSDALEAFHDAIERGDTSGINKLLDSVLMEEALHVPPARRPEFAQALLQAHLGILKERTRGVPAGPTVLDLLEAYLRERKLNSKSAHEARAAYERFVRVIGNKPATEVTKADVRQYREHLFSSPSNRKGSVDGKLSPTSVKKHLSVCATVFRFAVGQGLLESSPFDGGLTRVVRAGIERRLPYDAADLKALFQCEAFSKLTGARRWIPLLALVTGARLEELGGLRVQDVREESGIHFLDLVPTEERRLKNRGSRRRVPLHPDLIRLGFLDYVKAQPKDGRLFPDLKPGRFGKFTGPVSNWWARYTDACGVTDPQKAFHSLRHSFKDACRAAAVPEELHDALTGHSSGSVGRRYGTGPSLPVLAKALSRVTFLGMP